MLKGGISHDGNCLLKCFFLAIHYFTVNLEGKKYAYIETIIYHYKYIKRAIYSKGKCRKCNI